jgi:enhancing lycopene biosynthesis protein 2
MCIAPILAAAALGSKQITLTIGHDRDTAAKIEGRGAIHKPCKPDAAVIDRTNKIVSTPAYMEAKSLLEAEAGINQLVNSLLELCP